MQYDPQSEIFKTDIQKEREREYIQNLEYKLNPSIPILQTNFSYNIDNMNYEGSPVKKEQIQYVSTKNTASISSSSHLNSKLAQMNSQMVINSVKTEPNAQQHNKSHSVIARKNGCSTIMQPEKERLPLRPNNSANHKPISNINPLHTNISLNVNKIKPNINPSKIQNINFQATSSNPSLKNNNYVTTQYINPNNGKIKALKETYKIGGNGNDKKSPQPLYNIDFEKYKSQLMDKLSTNNIHTNNINVKKLNNFSPYSTGGTGNSGSNNITPVNNMQGIGKVNAINKDGKPGIKKIEDNVKKEYLTSQKKN
jgi:hypothetical protein